MAARPKNLIPKYKLTAASFVLACMVAANANAEPAYRWKDANGHTFYGSKPPAGAKNVEKVVGHAFSRYSSEKLLKAYRPRLSQPSIQERDIKLPKDESSATTAKASGDMPDVDSLDMPDQPIDSQSTALRQGKISLDTNSSGQLTECEVEVKNPTASDIANVSVTFEFSDGSLIPAMGPETIAANSDETFKIPAEQLPLTLRAVSALASRGAGSAEIKAASRPKVIIRQLAPAKSEN